MKHRKTIKRVLEYIRPYGFKITEMLILAVITVAFYLIYSHFDRTGS